MDACRAYCAAELLVHRVAVQHAAMKKLLSSCKANRVNQSQCTLAITAAAALAALHSPNGAAQHGMEMHLATEFESAAAL